MGVGITPDEVCAALNRLIGAGPHRKTNHKYQWRLVVKTSDGHEHAVRIDVNLHRKDRVAKQVPNDIADRLLIDRKMIGDVLTGWSHQQLVRHLQKHTLEQLREPAMKRFR